MATVTVNLAGINGTIGYGMNAANGMGIGNSGQVKNGSVFAGNVNNGSAGLIEQKRAQARKQAMKAIMDQFAGDNEVTDRMDGLRERNTQIKEEIFSLQHQRDSYAQEQEALKDQYGIDPEGQEQKDLDLIRKANKAMAEGNLGSLSKDELDRVANMGELTEYQRRMLEYDEVIEDYDALIDGLKDEKKANTGAIKSIKQALLEENGKGMREAQNTADAILDAASDAIMGMVWQDAKNHIDEEMEKLVEAAKKQTEKKEEEEEKLEAVKEDTEEQEKLTEAIQESAADQSKLQNEIQKILKESDLLEEDLKGLVVDGTM